MARALLMIVLLMAAGTAAYAQSSTSLAISPNPATLGQSVTLMATVSTASGDVTGGLGVTFFDGGDILDTVLVAGGPSSGTATLTTTFSTTGSHTITAAFNGTNTTGASNTAETLSVIPASSTTSLNVSPNPSPAGRNVTMTATVTATGGDVTGGLGVTFFDGPDLLGTVTIVGGPLTGTATLTVPFATAGSHVITAAFNGTSTVSASNSTGTATVGPPGDSSRLRALQIIATQVVAQYSGQAISGAVDNAIAEGFDGGGNLVTPDGAGMRLNLGADPNHSRGPQDWMVWADVRRGGLDDGSDRIAGTFGRSLTGYQVNSLVGLTHKLTDTVLVGVFGGYETFDYSDDQLAGRLHGDGWTAGSYLGWKLTSAVRFNAAAAYSGIDYNAIAGTAAGTFNGSRLLISTGLTGTYKAYGLGWEPSARIYELWERENAYTDTLGTLQDSRTFSTGNASIGMKVSYPIDWSSTVAFVPYVGLYGDYYINSDDGSVAETATGLPADTMPVLKGFSARVAGGLGVDVNGGMGFNVGGDYGGIGGNTHIWTLRADANLRF